MDLNYYDTLIAVADDCLTTTSVVPVSRGAKKSVAIPQYEMLATSPHEYTQADVLFATWLEGQDLPDTSEAEVRCLREEFFAKLRACLRTSPLPKKYGWGLLFDQAGKVALCPMESPEYQALLTADRVRVLKALRSSRA